MALRTVTVKPSGGDYTSLAAAEAGEQGDLVALDRQLVIECYAMQDTTPVAIDGWTTDATRYITITVPPAERHDGKWNANKYRLSSTADEGFTLKLASYTVIEFLQVTMPDHANRTSYANAISGVAVTGCIIRNNVIKKGNSRTISDCGGITFNSSCTGYNHIINNIIYDFIGTGCSGLALNWDTNRASGLVANNTLVDCTYGSRSESGFHHNNIAQGCTDGYDCWQTGDYNISNVAGDTDANISPSYRQGLATTVSFVDAANDDFHLASGDTYAKDHGSDLSGDSRYAFNYDIDGQTRSGSWDIGADEYVASGAVVYKAISESLQTSETVSRTMIMGRIATESVQVSESIYRLRMMVRLIVESIQVAESLLGRLGIYRFINEIVQIAENLSTLIQRFLLKFVNESVQIIEVTLRAMGMTRPLNETVQIGEALLKRTLIYRIFIESIQIAESIVRVRVMLRLVSESVQIAENTLKIITRFLYLVVTESVQIAEVVFKWRDMSRFINESVQITESFWNKWIYQKIVNELVQVQEFWGSGSGGSLISLSIRRVLAETVQITESIWNIRPLIQIINEAISISESMFSTLITTVIRSLLAARRRIFFFRGGSQ
jgi:hypothetical protein